MKKILVGLPTSIILMLSSCTATLEELQNREERQAEEVTEQEGEEVAVEESIRDSEDDEETDESVDEDTSLEESIRDSEDDEETDEDSEDTTETDEETEVDEDEETEEDTASNDEDEDSEDVEIDEDITEADIPEEVIQEFIRLSERVETMESRLSTLERHLNEAEDEIAKLTDALGNRTSTSSNDNVDEDANRDDIEVLTTEDGQGSRSTPFEVGDTVAIEIFDYANGFNRLFGTAEITITEVIRGEEAYETLLTESRFNDEAPDGYEWAVITVSFYLADFEDDDVSVAVSDSITIVTDSGSKPPNTYALPPNPLSYTEIFSGGEVIGNVAKLVPEGEPFLIYYDSFKAEDLFFIYVE